MKIINISALVFNPHDENARNKQIINSIRKTLEASPFTDNPQIRYVWGDVNASFLWNFMTSRDSFIEGIVAPLTLRYNDIY